VAKVWRTLLGSWKTNSKNWCRKEVCISFFYQML
jgi:hypothetical protein